MLARTMVAAVENKLYFVISHPLLEELQELGYRMAGRGCNKLLKVPALNESEFDFMLPFRTNIITAQDRRFLI